MLKVVIVGAGLMGHHHAMTARRLGAQVVGVVDHDEEATAPFAKLFPDARISRTIGDMLSGTPVDVAHVCTPEATHLPVAIELAAAGVHALIEKPLAATAEETRIVADSFRRSGALFCPVHQYAFQRGMDEAVASLPRLGPVRRIAFDIASAGGGDDRRRFDRIAGEIVPHPLSMLQRLRPGIVLRDVAWAVTRADAGEWLVTASDAGATIAISLSLASRPTRFSTSVSATHGTVEVNNFHGYAVTLGGEVSRAAKIGQPFAAAGRHLVAATANLAGRTWRRETAYPGLRRIMACFHAAAARRDERLLPVSVAQTIDVAEARDLILARIAAAAR